MKQVKLRYEIWDWPDGPGLFPADRENQAKVESFDPGGVLRQAIYAESIADAMTQYYAIEHREAYEPSHPLDLTPHTEAELVKQLLDYPDDPILVAQMAPR